MPDLYGASVESDSSEDFMIFPLSLGDVRRNRCESTSEEDVPIGNNRNKFFSVAMGHPPRQPNCIMGRNSHEVARKKWKHAAMKARTMSDSWQNFHLEKYPTEKARRYRYNALKKTWVQDEVTVKMETTPFNHGAMRECFRMKKLSNFSLPCRQDWSKDVNNYVAKRYMVPVARDVYFEDVKLQMDAKLWSEEYNRHNPPKKVDIFQMALLEFLDRPGQPLYHIEHFIQGKYVKYNSNSGYISDETHRSTPHAFSHFTFERSGHELIVVDVQGVGDLYTDPQIHTADGQGYGDGNLGTRGMALFFHSHICNDICESLGLTKFDLADTEVAAIQTSSAMKIQAMTIARGAEEVCVSPGDFARTHLIEFLRHRSDSCMSSTSSISPPESPRMKRRYDSFGSQLSHDGSEPDDFDYQGMSPVSPTFGSHTRSHHFHHMNHHFLSGESASERKPCRRQRYISESSMSMNGDHEKEAYSAELLLKSKPSNVAAEMDARSYVFDSDDSVLGRIHLDMAKYHELRRFTSPDSDTYDTDAAMFHLKHAADCGNLEAVITLARIYLQLPHDVLPDLQVQDTAENCDEGLANMTRAAYAGDRSAMVFMAKAYDTGENLGTQRARDWLMAVYWYEEAVHMEDGDNEGCFDATMDDPPYLLLARQAEIYSGGGFGVAKDSSRAADLYTEAAESATSCMKGRLATKYYMKVEEVLGEAEE